MANSKERINALEAQMRDMFKSDHYASGCSRHPEWESKFRELQDRVEHNARHAEVIDWESKFQELQDRVELLSRAMVNTPAGGYGALIKAPSRQMMNAFFDNIGLVQQGEQSGSQSGQPPTDEPDTQDYEKEDVVGAFPQWCNAVTTQVGNPEENLSGEKPKDMSPKRKGDVPRKGLMYVDIKVNGKAINAMVDTGATHNYISSTEVERLGLTLEKGCGRVKAINTAAQPVAGIARSVLIKVGPYEGRTNFSVVTMDDSS
ncbi:hypothetical protein RJ639_024732 [Escallonia herrerae]|uniref:Uncharacterized protein n=1 Tax=Escallonia herrerae TaxID=1293975 RepID=A0AA88S7A1_9ASTE|nr:hypothetical protein RJ639_026133 [Escallonia herrerae]KAK2997962.1 hypothetical protein RJ639_024732 [Escallonia herrerae]